jgi:hypothetical protein
MSEKVDGEPQQPSLVALLSRLQGALAVLGIFLYGALYIAYAYFYHRLGLRPEDVGLGYGTTILRSSGLIVLLVVPLLMIGIFLFMRRRRRPASERESDSAVDLLMSASLRSSESQSASGATRRRGASVLGDSVVVVVPATLKPGESPPSRGVSPPTSTSNLGDWVLKLSLGVVLVVFPSVIYQAGRLPYAVTSRADAVEAGREVSPLRFGPLTILDITAHHARIAWIGEAPSGNDLNTRDIMYLGQANSQLVFFDPNTKQHVLRLPASSVMLTLDNCSKLRTTDGSCPTS